jgi:hypothetical protein
MKSIVLITVDENGRSPPRQPRTNFKIPESKTAPWPIALSYFNGELQTNKWGTAVAQTKVLEK